MRWRAPALLLALLPIEKFPLAGEWLEAGYSPLAAEILEECDPDRLAALVAAGANPDEVVSGIPLLSHAVWVDSRRDGAPCLAALLAAAPAIDLEATTNEGQTALMEAANLRQQAAVMLLLRAGARVDGRDPRGNSALDLALSGAEADECPGDLSLRRWSVA